MRISAPVVLLLAVCCLLLVTSTSAKRNRQYKQHGAPVDHERRPRGPTREFGRAVMKKFAGDGSEVSFKVGRGEQAKVVFASDDDADDEHTYSIATPGNGFKTTDQLEGDGSIRGRGQQKMKGKKLRGEGVKVREQLNAGKLKVKARGKNRRARSKTVVAILKTNSPLSLCFEPTSVTNYINEAATFKVGICDKDTGDLQAGLLDAATLTYTSEAGGDSGSASAVIGDDGWAFFTFTPTSTGAYALTADADAHNVDGDEIERQVHSAIKVISREITAIRSASFSLTHDDSFVEVSLSLAVDLADGFVPSEDDRYIVFAEIYGDGDVEVTTTSGFADLDNGILEVFIQREWFSDSGATAPFTLKHLRISTRDSVPLVMEDNFAVDSSFDSLPASGGARRLLGMFESEEERQTRMSMGRPPAREETGAGRKLLQSNHALLLLHGYCADKNPWLTSRFSVPTRQLQDFDKSRSHDYFANLIKNLGADLAGCGIVAHSQGGAASLHLYTYYWSCIDYANTGGTRLIQSVGTPYQGTALSGNLAAIADVFGTGCGYNTDMTYSGASSWLANIPTWARAKINYYTTSFEDNWWSYDYCNFVTDPFLDDPDDGVTEKGYGQLSGAYNRGHKEGQCHTDEMSDPAQYNDIGRINTMNANAFY